MSVTCPICGTSESRSIYRAQRQPAILNHYHATREAALCARAVDLHFVACLQCGFVWNAAYDAKAIRYQPGYINDQSCSGVFQTHLGGVIDELCTLARQRPGMIVEIGCGQGDVLRRMCSLTNRAGIGFDPAYCGRERIDNVAIHAESFATLSFAKLEGSPISLIYARHVLEHLRDPLATLRLIAGVEDAQLFFEVPGFDWIAAHGAFYDLFHEHCSLFNMRSFRTMMHNAGIETMHLRDAFTGQYLIAHSSSQVSSANSGSVAMAASFDAIARRFESERLAWREAASDLINNGPVLIWGAGAKGVSLLNHLGLTHDDIEFVIDIHPEKRSRYVALTGQRVISPHEIHDAIGDRGGRAAIIVMNPNYKSEIELQLRTLNVNAAVHVMDQRMLLEVHR